MGKKYLKISFVGDDVSLRRHRSLVGSRHTGGFEARLKSAVRCTVSSTGISGVRPVAGKKPARGFWTEAGAEPNDVRNRLRDKKEQVDELHCGGGKTDEHTFFSPVHFIRDVFL